MNMDKNEDAWKYWYPGKEFTIDECIPELENTFKIHGVSRVLDLGCGTGRHTLYFAEKGYNVYGFDLSSYAIQRSIERLKKRNLSAHLIVWDMTKKFPYKNNFFDAVVAVRVIHHAKIDTIKQIISEINRTTKNGGYFYAQVPLLERALADRRSDIRINWIEPGTRIPLEGNEKGIPHHDFTKQELQKLLSDSSFEVEEICERNRHFNFLSKNVKP